MFYFRLKHVFARFGLFWDVLGELKKITVWGGGQLLVVALKEEPAQLLSLFENFQMEKKLMEKFPQENSPVEIQKLERLNQENLARFPIIICSIAVSANFTSRPSIQIQEQVREDNKFFYTS